MVAAKFTKQEIDAIEFLRSKTKNLITAHYDTDYNLLRWAQGYDFKLEEALYHLTRHLKFRRFYDLDNTEQIVDNKVLKLYFPLGLVGETGKNNHLLVIENAGRIDLQGILNTVQLNAFLTQRFKFQEMMLNEINATERKNGAQCSVIYILDLEGLKLDSKLLSVVTGQYHILWNLVYTNYPEWIDTLVMVNVPTFISIVWRAVAPLLPERTKSKVCIFSCKDEYVAELQKHCELDHVPKHWGGTMVDGSGDPMCRDRLIIPNENIPEHLYWKPDDSAPAHSDLASLTLVPGRHKVVTIKLHPYAGKTFLSLNRYAERSYTMAIYHSNKLEDSEMNNLEEMDEWIPVFLYPAMPTVDLLQRESLGPGTYKFRFGNEQAWIRTVTVYYRIRFLNGKGDEVPCEVNNC